MATRMASVRKTIRSFLEANAVTFGHVDLVRWLIEHRRIVPSVERASTATNEQDVLAVCQLLHAHDANVFRPSILSKAALHGHLGFVQWLCAHSWESFNFPVIDDAAEGGHLDTIKWLHENRVGDCMFKAVIVAVMAGRADILEWLIENRNVVWVSSVLGLAARSGDLALVQWLARVSAEEGMTIDAMVCAARQGHVGILAWLYENQSDGCVWCVQERLEGWGAFVKHNQIYRLRDSFRWLCNRLETAPRCGEDCGFATTSNSAVMIAVYAARRGDVPLLREVGLHYRAVVRRSLEWILRESSHPGIITYLQEEFPDSEG